MLMRHKVTNHMHSNTLLDLLDAFFYRWPITEFVVLPDISINRSGCLEQDVARWNAQVLHLNFSISRVTSCFRYPDLFI